MTNIEEYLYLLKTYGKDNSLLKFGYTSDIWKRLSQYKSSNPHIEVLYIAKLENAYLLEQEFHNNNNSISGNEWYDENMYDSIISFIKKNKHKDCTNDIKIKKIRTTKYQDYDSFKSILKEYCNLVDNNHDEEKLKKLELLEPSIKEIVNKLGTEQVRTSNYIKKNLNEMVFTKTDEFKNVVKYSLLEKFNLNQVYTSAEIKQELQKIYNKNKGKKKAKATDLADYFIIDKRKRRVGNMIVDSVEIVKLK